MTATPASLMLLDTPSLYFRAFYGVPATLTAPDGMPVNAIRGLLDFITHLVGAYRPDRMVACFDADWRPAFRVEAIPSYKAHRVVAEDSATGVDIEEAPDALTPQLPVIDDTLDALGIARLGVEGYEADDVIGTLATVADPGVDVVTGDRDLFQLVDDERRVRVLYTARGVGKLEIFDEAAVTAKYGVPGRAYADFATLRGDPSDGLPGVKGVGDKTAATLITTYRSLDGLLAAAEDPVSTLSPTVRRKLAAARDYLEVAPAVVRVVRDIAVPALDARLPASPVDPEAIERLGARYNLGGSLRRVVEALAANARRD